MSSELPFDPTAASYFSRADQADADGVVLVGGKLTTAWLLTAYANGVFPWPHVIGRFEKLAWFSPDPRAILEFDSLKLDQRTRQRIRGGQFTPTLNREFAAVMAACAAPRREDGGTWITAAMQAAYQRLHEQGFAHSVEVWQDGELAGGVYGVSLGGFFAGESMFHRRTDASKAALYFLIEHLRERGYTLFDVQLANPHLVRLGAVELPRREYLRRLQAAIRLPVAFGPVSTGDGAADSMARP